MRQHKLRFVDDASNADERFARSRVRERVWSALTRAFPDAEVTLVALARRAQQAQALLVEVAMADLAALVDDVGRLDVACWRALTQARRNNALRAWLLASLERGAPETLIERLMVELPDGAAAPLAGRPCARVGSVSRPPRTDRHARAPTQPRLASKRSNLSRPGVYDLPSWRGGVRSHAHERMRCAGIASSRPVAWWRAAAASNGRRSRVALPRSLKKQYQAAGIAAWQREGPLLYAGDVLVFVPGLGLDARACALRTAWPPLDAGAAMAACRCVGVAPRGRTPTAKIAGSLNPGPLGKRQRDR